MSLRYRPMQPKDVRECVRIIAEHPLIGPRYGNAIADLGPAWLRLLGSEAMITAVFEELDGTQVAAWGVGVSIIVQDDFLSEIKRPPLSWLGPELAKRVARGDSLVLLDREVREANSRGGLNLLTWEGCIHPKFEKRTELYQRLMGAFLEQHRGYLWKEAIAAQAETADRLRWTLHSGGLLWNPIKRRYAESSGKDFERIAREPHIAGVTREIERNRPSSWVGALFDYRPPRLGFSSGEQRLLLAALSGATDEELAKELGVSPGTVKNTWRSVYDRATSHLPELFSGHSQPDEGFSERGKEKRRHLLAYLREHLEELRPVSRKLLTQATRKEQSPRAY